MSDMTLFEGNSLISSDLFKSLQETDDNLAGNGGGGVPRISIRGGRFRQIVGGEQINVNSSGSLKMNIVTAAKIGRTYFEGEYNPENPAAPTCWSVDTQTPAPEVPAESRMSARCMDCPMNIKGSGQGESRACRFSQRLAVTLEGEPTEVYQLQLPATSIFGEAKDGKMGMQAYAKYLKAHKTPSIAVITEMYFDEDSDTPKLYFKPARPLTEEELKQAVENRNSDEATKAITMTVSQTDKASGYKPKAEDDKPVEKAEPKEEPKDEGISFSEEVDEEPKVAKKKAAKAEVVDEDIDDMVSDWD